MPYMIEEDIMDKITKDQLPMLNERQLAALNRLRPFLEEETRNAALNGEPLDGVKIFKSASERARTLMLGILYSDHPRAQAIREGIYQKCREHVAKQK